MSTVLDEWGMCCPDCGKDDRLSVQVTTMAKLMADGTDADTGCHDWNNSSSCECECGWSGRVFEAIEAAPAVCPRCDSKSQDGSPDCPECGEVGAFCDPLA